MPPVQVHASWFAKGITYISEQFHQRVFLTTVAPWEHAVQRLHCVPCRKACAFLYHNGSDWVSPSSSLPCRLPYRPSVSRRSSRPLGTAPSPDVPGSGRLSRRLCPRGIPFRTRCSETLLRSETALLSACTLASQPVHGTKTGPPNE